MSKMTKKVPKAKIPRGLSDKDMMKDFIEEDTLEEKFVRAAKAQEQKAQAEAAKAPPADLARGGFTRELTDELGKALTQLKMELALKGITGYTFKVKRDGESIVLMPKYK